MISLIRDYLDVLSSILNTSNSSFEVVQITLKFCIESFLGFCHYFFTFSWVRDVMSLPIVLPKCQELILSGRFFYEELNIPFFDHFAQPEGGIRIFRNVFALGFLNSLFCCLPFSTTHFLAIHRLFVQGVVAGAASTLGIIIGQCTFIFCTIFGIRWALIPWLSLEPLSYIFGMYLLFTIVYDMSNDNTIRPVGLSEKHILGKMMFLSALMTWTEEANISQYLTNLTLSNQPSVLTLGGTANSGINLSYFFGILIGHIFFSILFIGLSVVVKKSLFAISTLPYSTWVQQTNTVFLVSILALGISSIPYYSLDYLVTGPLGTISEDPIFDDTIFSQKNTKDPSRLLTSMDILFPFTIDTDISYFDRDDHGVGSGFFKRYFEQLNYQGEYAWLIRRDKKPNLYASGQTSETTIRDLFHLSEKTSDKNPSSLSTDSKESIMSPKTHNSTLSGDFGPTAVKKRQDVPETDSLQSVDYDTMGSDQLLNAIITEESFVPKTIRATDRDLLKLRKRFDQNYEEKRESYLIGDSFHQSPQLEIPQTPVEVALKQKFYTNRVYKTLLNIEIDSFLRRQPTSFALTEQQEKDMYKKRIALARYHDTIRAYQQIPYKEEFNDLFRGSKTFVDRAYNHQFKGTLGVMRRLFAVTLDNDENATQNPVIKFDMPLSVNSLSKKSQFAHEELQKKTNTNSLQPVNWLVNYTSLPTIASQPKRDLKQTNVSNSPFLETNDSTPFYLGWDNQTRQMILTKRFNPNSNTIAINTGTGGTITNENPLLDREFRSSLTYTPNEFKTDSKSKKEVVFTTWPLDPQSIMSVKSKPTNQAVTLFEPTSNPDLMAIFKLTNSTINDGGDTNIDVFCFPANIRYLTNIPENLVPNKGGFVWPGSQYKYLVNNKIMEQ